MKNSYDQDQNDGFKVFAKVAAQGDTWAEPSMTQEAKRPESKPKRKKKLGIWLTHVELAIIEAKVEAAHSNMSGYIRAALLTSQYRAPTDPKLVAALLKINLELTAQGRALNHIVKQMGSGLVNSTEALAMIDAIRAPLILALRTINEALMPEGALP